MNIRKHIVVCRWLVLISLMAAIKFSAEADDQAVSEHQLKSAFIYNFTKYVEWPSDPGYGDGAPFVIGVVGDAAFSRQLSSVMRSENVHGHPITVRHFAHGAVPQGCKIVFISRAESAQIDTVLKAAAGKPVLTVTETAGAAAKGSMINLLLVDGTIKMEINRKQARRERLEISSYLLKLAKIVETEKQP